MGNKHLRERKRRQSHIIGIEELAQEYIFVEQPLEKRISRLNRQIEEAIYNIKPEDYNDEGQLKEPTPYHGDNPNQDIDSDIFYKKKDSKVS